MEKEYNEKGYEVKPKEDKKTYYLFYLILAVVAGYILIYVDDLRDYKTQVAGKVDRINTQMRRYDLVLDDFFARGAGSLHTQMIDYF